MSILVADTTTHEEPARLAEVIALRPRQDGEWTVAGQPLRDPKLRKRITAVLADAAAMPGAPGGLDGVDERDHASARTALDRAHAHVSGLLQDGAKAAAVPALVAQLVEIDGLRLELVRARDAQRSERYAAVRSALGRLRGVCSIAKMLERAPIELCRCGFDRAFVSRVEESMWLVENVHVEGDAEWAAEILRVAQARPQRLDHSLHEAEMMRRRAPVLVRDAQHDPHTNAAIGAASLSRSYVAAPIMPEGRIIGFLHADCYLAHRDVDEDDLAALWMFAEGFGYAFQRTMLLERLRGARDQIQRMTRVMASAMDNVCADEVSLKRSDEKSAALSGMGVAASLVNPESRLETLLSRREIEVLGLMAQGRSNGEIATHLVISEGTVKSHVKHILRKLRAANRAEAVFRFMRLTALSS